ncbi:hypothetical protein Tco_1007729, partial [Tanacetum coccineum]
ALSITFASVSTIAPISIDDCEVVGMDDQAAADEDAGFPVSSVRLASLLRYTRSPGLKLVLRTLEL